MTSVLIFILVLYSLVQGSSFLFSRMSRMVSVHQIDTEAGKFSDIYTYIYIYFPIK